MIGRFWGTWNYHIIAAVHRSSLNEDDSICENPSLWQVMNPKTGVKTRKYNNKLEKNIFIVKKILPSIDFWKKVPIITRK